MRSETSPHTAMERVGRNTGNLMFQYACFKHIQNPKVTFLLEEKPNLEELREQIDVLVIPAANQLNPQWDLKWWAHLIEVIDKPVVVVGLGTQARISEGHTVRLQPGTVRFLELISERAEVVGVRGPTTLEVMERYGVHNGVITGCPSHFINGDIDGQRIATQLDRLSAGEMRRVNFLYGTLEEYTRSVERNLYSLAAVSGGRLIRQTDSLVLKWMLDGQEPKDVSSYLAWEARTVAPGLSVDEYKRDLLHRGTYYFDARAWIDEVACDDVSVGMRIHGAVAAVQGGSLGVCVAFDSRTLELAQTMGYPYVLADDALEAQSLAELGQRTQFSADGFDKRRVDLRESLKRSLENFGIVTDL